MVIETAMTSIWCTQGSTTCVSSKLSSQEAIALSQRRAFGWRDLQRMVMHLVMEICSRLDPPRPLLTFCAILNLEIPLKMLKRAGAGTHKYASGLRIYKVMLTTSHWESEVISLLEVPNYSTCIIWLIVLAFNFERFWFVVHCFSCFFWLCVLLSVCNLLC